MADRILVMSRGRVVGERRGAEATEDDLLALATAAARPRAA